MKKFLLIAVTVLAAQASFAGRITCEVSSSNTKGIQNVDVQLELKDGGQQLDFGVIGGISVKAYYVFSSKIGESCVKQVDVMAQTADGAYIAGISYPRSTSHLTVNAKGNYLDVSCTRIVEESDPKCVYPGPSLDDMRPSVRN